MKVRTLPLCIPNSSKKDKGVNQQYKRRQPKKIFAANNMRRRLLLAVSLLVFISATALSIINYLRFASNYTEQSAANVQELVEQVSMNVENCLDGLGQLCLTPYYNSTVMAWLDCTPFSEQEALEKRREIENYLQQVMISPRKDIMRVYILADSIYSSARTGRSGITGAYYNEQWYHDALSTSEYVFLPVTPDPGNTTSSRIVVSVANQIYSLQDNKKSLGVIRIDANYNSIKAICDRVTVNEYGALMIIDSNGNIVYINSKLSPDINIEQIHGAIQENDFCVRKFSGTDYIINSHSVAPVGWQIVAINAKAEITKEAQETLLFNMIFAVVMAGIGVLISVFFISRSLSPLYDTINVMEKVEAGDLNVRANVKCTEEIAYLNGTFNRMLTKIQEMMLQEKQLTKEIYEAKYLQKEAQLEALQRQIQPHFLFNTLGTISILAKCGRISDVIQGIDQLATLLRGVVNAGKEISLEAELKITESYLHLQQLRHDALLYDIRADGVDLNYPLHALTIQPIVENAITHGCGVLSQNAFIQIDMWYEGNMLIISVYDNGAGMDPQVLSQLQQRLKDEGQRSGADLSGIGLVNIQARIRHRFGSAYGIHVQSEADGGTTVTLLLPRE